MAFKKKIKSMRVDTLIGKHSKIIGDVLYTGGVHIEGEVEGNLMADQVDKGFVVVSESGLVKGEIRGPTIIVYGTVNGDVYATGTIELAASAKITGSVYYNLLEMATGAAVNGNLVHQQSAQDKKKSG
ncbi:MAG: polymer-forming cytoskeletal protein [Gammaproteobacteria bacterium]